MTTPINHAIQAQAGYEAALVLAFIRAHTITKVANPGRGHGFTGRDQQLINDIPVRDGHLQMWARWEAWNTVPLDRLDRTLMHYDLMLCDFEHWAEMHYGRDGYVD